MDTKVDAAILWQLQTDGLDGKDQPLFRDVERVYELLGQAKTEEVGAGIIKLDGMIHADVVLASSIKSVI